MQPRSECVSLEAYLFGAIRFVAMPSPKSGLNDIKQGNCMQAKMSISLSASGRCGKMCQRHGKMSRKGGGDEGKA